MKTGQFDYDRFRAGFQPFLPTMLAGLVIMLFGGIAFTLLAVPAYIFVALVSDNLVFANIILEIVILKLLVLAAVIIGLVSMIAVFALYLFPLFLIIDRKMDFWEAMEESRKKAQQDLLGFFGFTLVIFFICTAGMFVGCGLGMLIAYPFTWCATAVAYRELWPEPIEPAPSQLTQT
jgi:uncharacterized membrane protein